MPKRIYLLSLDALPYYLLARFKKEWELKNFQKLEKQAGYARGLVAPFPDATTPPAHAGLFCGCPATEHNIISFEEPEIIKGEVHPWKKVMGFDARRLRAEPLWVSFLKTGARVLMLHFPLSVPVEPYCQEKLFGKDFSDRLIVIEAFSQKLAEEKVIQSEKPGRKVELALSKKERVQISLPKRSGSELTLLPEKNAGVYLLRLNAPGSKSAPIYFATGINRIFSHPREIAKEYLENAGAFVAGGGAYSYWQGKFGKTIAQGGEGEAERMLAKTLELVGEHFSRAIKYSLEKIDFEVGFFYFPGIDTALHLFASWLEPEVELEPKIREILESIVKRMFIWADKILGLFLEQAGKDDLLVVVSDHGMASVFHTFYPNQVLLERGYLVWEEKKSCPNLERSQAVYHQSNSGYIVINSRRRGGVVREEERTRLAERIAREFENYRGKILKDIILVEESGEIPFRGEIYLVPNYQVGLSHKVEGKVFESGIFGGQHHYWSESEPMLAILYLKGAGISPGKNLGRRSYLELAKTIAGLCGIDPPKKAQKGPIRF